RSDTDSPAIERFPLALHDALPISVPVIASLNGHRPGGWTKYAKQLEEAGADAIELNVYFLATDPDASAEEVERRTLETVAAVTRDRKSTRLNSSHVKISYAVFC